MLHSWKKCVSNCYCMMKKGTLLKNQDVKYFPQCIASHGIFCTGGHVGTSHLLYLLEWKDLCLSTYAYFCKLLHLTSSPSLDHKGGSPGEIAQIVFSLKENTTLRLLNNRYQFKVSQSINMIHCFLLYAISLTAYYHRFRSMLSERWHGILNLLPPLISNSIRIGINFNIV